MGAGYGEDPLNVPSAVHQAAPDTLPCMVAILAYGSLIDDPGAEITARIASRRAVRTPFRVEFARPSVTRGGAFTLAVVEEGGAQVDAELIVLDDTVPLQEAKSMLWRRETQQIGTGRQYHEVPHPGPNRVLVKEFTNFHGQELVLYVDFPPGGKSTPLDADHLAETAIASARGRTDGKDGISYLLSVKRSGIVTQLMHGYEKSVLDRTGTTTLEEALQRARVSAVR